MRWRVFFQIPDYFRGVIKWSGHVSSRNGEVHGLLAAIGALPAAPTSAFRRENLRLAVVLLYTTGLRLGELVRLTLGDYDPREHTLLIRDSKFHKSRLVPLSIDGTREIDQYLAARRSQRIA
jgi:site-specific recombinase XerD